MAFIQKNLENDETLAPTTAGSALVGGGSPGVAPQQAPAGTGSGFVNLRQYLDANKNQSTQVADKLSDTLKSEAQGITSEIGKTGEGFKADVEAKNPINQAVIDEAKKDPIAVEADRAKAEDFRRQATGTYSGANSVEEYDPYNPLKSRVDEGVRRAWLSDTESGRFELLQGMGGPQRTGGEANLDQYLLGADPANLDIVKQGGSELLARKQALSDLVGQSRGVVGAKRGQLSDLSAQIGKDFGDENSGVVGSLNNEITSGYASAMADAQAQLADAYKYNYPQEYRDEIAAYIEAMKGFVPTISDPAGLPTVREDPGVTIPGFEQGTRENNASADQYARERALESLLGREFGVLPTGQSSQAGTFGGLLSDVIGRVPDYSKDPLPYIPPRPTVQPVPLPHVDPTPTYIPPINPVDYPINFDGYRR